MASLSRNSDLWDPVRGKWVAKTPEEEIRQGWIAKMVDELSYPLSHLCVEKALVTLPHLHSLPLPQRRIDILVFAKENHGALYPLLMIECKATPLSPRLAEQVIGYNAWVKAPFVALANRERILTGKYDGECGEFTFQEGLPSYSELLAHVKR